MKLSLDKLQKFSGGLLVLGICFSFIGADPDGCETPPPVSSSGVNKATVKVPVGPDGLTTEQRNVGDRLKVDNEPGAIKHLYVISSFTGDVLIYSTVRGKVTSGGKRLTPTTVQSYNNNGTGYGGFSVPIGNSNQTTTEVLQDDGTYGSSGDYLFWFDSRGNYHQQYASACIIHISSVPLAIKHAIIDVEAENAAQQGDPTPLPVIKGKK